MKLFNRFLQNHESDTDQSESTNDWKNMDRADEEVNTELKQENERLAQQERQEHKLIGTLVHDASILRDEDYQVSDQDRNKAYEALTNGQITTSDKSALLQQIAAPLQRTSEPENVLASLDSKHERRILAYMSGAGFDNWQNISVSDLTRTFTNYPTPYELTQPLDRLLADVEAHNPPEKYQEYLKAAERFQNKFYGKRFQYYQAFKSLQEKADHFAAEQESRRNVLAAYHQGDTIPVAPLVTEPATEPITEPINQHSAEPTDTAPSTKPLKQPEASQLTEKITVRYLDAKEAKKTLKRSKIDGDNFYYDGQEYSLTPKTLENYGLAPAYGFELQNAKIDLSRPFQIGTRTAIMAYVTTGKETKVCSYYRSNSQGIWRYLPDYVSSYNPKEIINWYGKGYDEESLNLPNATQYALELITNTQEKADLNTVQASHAFAGTAKRYNSRDEYFTVKQQHALRGEHYQEVPSTPTFDLGRMSLQKSSPDNLDLVGENAPDFSTSINVYNTSTDLYGLITVEGVRSHNAQLEYTFNHNQRNQAWLSHIEITNAPISSHGLRTAWATTGDYGTPLYEYTVQDGGYGNPIDRRGNYIGMWENYLSRMPLIQKYLRSRNKSTN